MTRSCDQRYELAASAGIWDRCQARRCGAAWSTPRTTPSVPPTYWGVDETDLPPIVSGVATRMVFVGMGYAEPLDEPVPYEGYPCGPVVAAWSGPVTPTGQAHLWHVSARDPSLSLGGPLMESVARAKGDAAQIWRTYRARARQPQPTRQTSESDSSVAHKLAQVVASGLINGVARTMPELSDLFPFRRSYYAEALVDGGGVVLRMRDHPSAQFPQSEDFAGPDLSIARSLLDGRMLLPELGDDPAWRSRRVFTFVGEEAALQPPHKALVEAANRWVAFTALPAIDELNRRRIERVIPPPPAWDVARLAAATVVLESEGHSKTGTAFALAGYGFVTCDHCVFEDTVAFTSNPPSAKHPVTVLRHHGVVDLAILDIPGLAVPALQAGDPTTLQVMSHVAVVGYPNHNIGDPAMFRPGLVVSSRMHHGVRRQITNAGIIAGMSGGPVVDQCA